MSDAPAIVHTTPSKITSSQIRTGRSALLATAALAFVAGVATATAVLDHSTDASSQALTIPHAFASMGGGSGQDASVPDASKVFAGKALDAEEQAPTF